MSEVYLYLNTPKLSEKERDTLLNRAAQFICDHDKMWGYDFHATVAGLNEHIPLGDDLDVKLLARFSKSEPNTVIAITYKANKEFDAGVLFFLNGNYYREEIEVKWPQFDPYKMRHASITNSTGEGNEPETGAMV